MKKIVISLFVVLLVFSFVGCTQKSTDKDVVTEIEVSVSDEFLTDELTLLERIYDDLDQDGDDESIELYTSAQIAPDGMMEWDTGHRWVLLVRSGNQTYPLFDNWVQYGELQFWISSFNNNKIESPQSKDLDRQIYVAVTTDVGFQLLNYYWDTKSLSYKKETVLNPPNQWINRHSNKYDIPDPSRIESEVNSKTP